MSENQLGRISENKVLGRVNVVKRVKIDGKWQTCSVVTGGGGKIKPDAVLVHGREENHPEGRYMVDFVQDRKRKRISAESCADAVVMAEAKRHELLTRRHAKVAGITLPEPTLNGGRSLREAVSTFLIDVQAQRKPKTHSAHKTALTYFLDSCHKPTLEQITKSDLQSFKTYLRNMKEPKQGDRSVYNKFASVIHFLKQHKITSVSLDIAARDWPTFTEEEVSTYTDDELQKFFAACDKTEKLWFSFFYETAMREQEVMNAEWSWIDFENKTATVRENKRFGFRPKAYKGRLIPLKSKVTDALKAWKEKSDATCGLIFPTSGCNPKQDFLDVCKAIAKRAGLTDFYLHKFRATKATHLLQEGMDIKSVQKVLGHSDLESTMRYLGGQQTEVLQAQVEKMKSRF